MKIKILLFAQLADLFGCAEKTVKEISDRNELIALLEKEQPDLSKHTYVVAVNQKIMHGNIIFKQGDIVALLPPFAGG